MINNFVISAVLFKTQIQYVDDKATLPSGLFNFMQILHQTSVFLIQK